MALIIETIILANAIWKLNSLVIERKMVVTLYIISTSNG